MLEKLRETAKITTAVAVLCLPVPAVNQIVQDHRAETLRTMSTADLKEESNQIGESFPIYPGYIGAAQVLNRGHEAARINDLLDSRNAK